MKKLLSIVLAVVMMASLVVSASAADHTQLIVAPGSNDDKAATVTTSGNSVVVDVKGNHDTTTDAAGGVALTPGIANFDMTNCGYVHIDIVSEVPFRIALLDRTGDDKSTDKWVTFTSEFFNSVVTKDKTAAGTVGTDADLVTNGTAKFFPAGEYQCVAWLGGVYNFKTTSGVAGWDMTKTNITGIYVEGMKPGKITINQLSLSSAADFESQSLAIAAAPSGDNGGSTGGNSDTATTTAAKATTTTVKKATNTTGDSAKTGDVSNAIVFVVVAAAAAGVVTMSAVSKKSKAR